MSQAENGTTAERPALPPANNGSLVPGSGPGGLVAREEPIPLYGVPAEEAHFWDYWQVLVRHRATVITFLVVALVVGTLWTFTTRPVFVAAAILRIEREEPRVLKFEEVVKTDVPDDQTQLQTHYKILQSRTLANRVIGLLRLDQHPEFQEGDGSREWLRTAEAWTRERLVYWVAMPPPAASSATDDVTVESPLTRSFQEHLRIEPVPNARLVKIAFESHDRDLTARVVNTLAEAFIAHQLDQKVEATRYATQFLAKQVGEAQERLEGAETRLNEFLRANDILFVTSDKVTERQDLITQQLTVISDALLKARAERIAKESLVQQALSRNADSVPAVLQSPLVAKLKEEVASLEGEYRKLGQTFKADYPRMQRLEQNIAEVRRQLEAEAKRVVAALDAEYLIALRNERGLQKALDDHRGLARRLGDQMSGYSLLRREVDTNRELYSSLLTRLKETQISSALFTSNISIVDRAEVPARRSRPRTGLTLLVASLVGLGGGVGLAFVFEYLDTNIKDAREVEAVLQVPTIGLVPAREALEGRRARRERLRAEREGEREGSRFALVAHTEMGSGLAETFRNLRTSLLYSAPDHPPKTFMVTSLQPEDGKTSLATNLAITLSQLGSAEVLLVDADMRRPNLHEVLGVRQAPGLSTFLTGQAELSAVLQATAIPNLYVVPSGRTPVNPAELLASGRLGQALEVLRERFAHVVFDCPPLLGVSDALVLAPRLEGVVLVLRQGRAGREMAQRAVRLVNSVRARVLGVILNDADLRGRGYADSYGYYGYRGYGSEDAGTGRS